MNRISDRLFSWIEPEAIEPQALEQAQRLSRMPFVFGHVALMPDCHLGKGATVGSVIATDGAIIPAAVGVDIGCGMIAVETNLAAGELPDSLEALRSGIEDRIPTGIGDRGRNVQLTPGVRARMDAWARDRDSADRTDASWPKQIGTLGGGNHFIEVCLDERDRVWLVLHSGSRGVGNKMAERHMKVAATLMTDMRIQLDDPDLSYLPETLPEFEDYMRDLHWAQDFARLNREEMMDRVIAALVVAVPHARRGRPHQLPPQLHAAGDPLRPRGLGHAQGRDPDEEGPARRDPGLDGNAELHRLGPAATRESFESAPHGAGRRMSRTQARKRFTLDDLAARMEGIACRVRPSLLDEHPDSYKDIDMVIDRSSDLVRGRARAATGPQRQGRLTRRAGDAPLDARTPPGIPGASSFAAVRGETPPGAISRGRSGRGSSPCSTPPRSPARTSPARRRRRRPRRARGAGSSNRRPGRRACPST